MTDYASRLKVSLVGDDATEFATKSGPVLAVGYERIVIGARGPYVEFSLRQINRRSTRLRRVDVEHYYYDEYRTVPDDVKVYEQRHRVAYADYLPDWFYVSPFELFVRGVPVIERLHRETSQLALGVEEVDRG